MNVLIVESDPSLATLWRRHVARLGFDVGVAMTEPEAMTAIARNDLELIVLDLDLGGVDAMAIADYAMVRRPSCRVIFVTASSFFSDGSIFAHCANACACLPASTPASDLAVMVEHYGQRRPIMRP